MCSEIQNQLAGMLTDVLFLPQYKLPNGRLRLHQLNTCFQNNMCAEATLGEIAISLILVISCEPVKIESESRKFLEEKRIYRLQ